MHCLGLGLGIVYLPQQTTQSPSSSSISPTNSTTGGRTSVNTVTTIQRSRLLRGYSLVTRTGATQPNPALRIFENRLLLLKGNATLIAYTLAAQLANQLPISSAIVTHSGGFTTYYEYETANDSTIRISVTPTVSSPLQVNYQPASSNLKGNATTLNPNFSMTSADAKIHDILSALGVPISNVTLYDQIRSLTPNDYQVQQSQCYQNIPLSQCHRSNPDNTTFYYGENPGFYYDFNPANGQLKSLIIIQDNWFNIPYNFPLRIIHGSPDECRELCHSHFGSKLHQRCPSLLHANCERGLRTTLSLLPWAIRSISSLFLIRATDKLGFLRML